MFDNKPKGMGQVIVLLVILSLALGSLLSLFDQLSVPASPDVEEPRIEEHPARSKDLPSEAEEPKVVEPPSAPVAEEEVMLERSSECTSAGVLSPECGTAEPLSLFKITNAGHTRLLRNVATPIYDGGLWKISEDASYDIYDGEIINPPVELTPAETESDHITISPLVEFRSGFFPTSLYTDHLSINKQVRFYPEELAFFCESNFQTPYSFTTTHYTFNEDDLMVARTLEKQQCLQLPENISDRIRSLAREVVSGHDTDYDKLKTIEDYLETNYEYDPTYKRSPESHEPNDWFLFEERRGICVNFNSAFVVLARCVGIPSRLVHGYAVKPIAEEQVVNTGQGHAWVEAPFIGMGWLPFDARPSGCGPCADSGNEICPECGGSGGSQGGSCEVCNGTGQIPAEKIPTKIHLNSVSSVVQKGYTFKALGEVLTIDNKPVLNMPVEIFINYEKARGGIRVGQGMATEGAFEITCNAPSEVPVDDYFVIAHAIETEAYYESWSESPAKIRLPSDKDTTDNTRIATAIEILTMDASVQKGQLISVEGIVKAENETPVNNVNIEVFINGLKERGGILIGKTSTDNSQFKLEAPIPADVDVGDYHVIAHLLGNNTYNESWSDPEVKIISATKIDLESPDTTDADSLMVIAGTLTEKLGTPIGNQLLTLSLAGLGEIGTVTTDEKGHFTYKYTFNEPGTYQIIVSFAETEYYLASQAVKDIKVFMPTQMLIDIPENAIVNEEVTLTGMLSEMNGVGIENQQIYVYLNDKEPTTCVTRAGGSFEVHLVFEEPGANTIEAVYMGNDYYSGSSATANIRIDDISINVVTPDVITRNEEILIKGALEPQTPYIEDQLVEIIFDDNSIAQVPTDSTGLFQKPYIFGSDIALGRHMLEYRVAEFNISTTQRVQIKAKTALNLTMPESVGYGNAFEIKAVLQDDMQFPIAGADIVLEDYAIVETTDSSGIAIFKHRVPDGFKADVLTVQCSFAGTDLYLPSIAEGSIAVTSSNAFIWFSIASALVIISGLTGFFIYRRHRKSGKSAIMPVRDDGTSAKVSKESTVITQPKVPPAHVQDKNSVNISITFPQIEGGFPDVWGLNEELDIECRISDYREREMPELKMKVHISLADRTLLETETGGYHKISDKYTEKGTLSVTGDFPGNKEYRAEKVRRKIRIVDYREEIVALFNSFVDFIQEQGTKITMGSTPRRIESSILNSYSGIDKAVLSNITTCFEVANYSTHKVSRRDYEDIYLSIQEIKQFCERGNE